MYDQGYTHARAGEPMDESLSSNSDYCAGYECGALDREEIKQDEINEAAQDFVDGYRSAEAGDEFEIALLESEAYRTGFRDGERMSGVAA